MLTIRVLKRLNFYFMLFLINSLLSGTRFYKTKNRILNFIGCEIDLTARVVGPLFIGPILKLKVGRTSFLGSDFRIYGNGEVIIGDNCDIAPQVTILTGTHEIGDEVRRAGKGYNTKVLIDDGVWIGGRTTIVNNIRIEKGVVIGCFSLVNKDCCKNNLYVGNPIRIVRELK